MRATSKEPNFLPDLSTYPQRTSSAERLIENSRQGSGSPRDTDRILSGQCIKLAITDKSQAEANGNVDIKLAAGYNKGAYRWRPGALRCYLTDVLDGHISAEQALTAAKADRATEQEIEI